MLHVWRMLCVFFITDQRKKIKLIKRQEHIKRFRPKTMCLSHIRLHIHTHTHTHTRTHTHTHTHTHTTPAHTHTHTHTRTHTASAWGGRDTSPNMCLITTHTCSRGLRWTKPSLTLSPELFL